jgi:hypothetical protein
MTQANDAMSNTACLMIESCSFYCPVDVIAVVLT